MHWDYTGVQSWICEYYTEMSRSWGGNKRWKLREMCLQLGWVCHVTLGKDRCYSNGWNKRYRELVRQGLVSYIYKIISLKTNKEWLPSGHATTLPITQASSWRCWISLRICSVWFFDTTRAAPIPQLNVLAISSSESFPSCCNHEKILGILQVRASENKQELFD